MSKADFQRVLTTAYREGHAWREGNRYSIGLRYEDLKKLRPEDDAAKEIISSFQSSDANLFVLSNAAHDRDPEFNGEVGPATIGLTHLKRCGCMSYVSDDLASVPLTDPYEIASLQSQVKSVILPATTMRAGSGVHWPDNCEWCENNIPTIRIAVNEATMPAHYKGIWEWLKTEAAKAYAEIGLRIEWVDWTQKTKNAEVNLWWRVLAGSTIGLAEFPNGTCDNNVFCNLDPGYRASKEMLLILLLHELGHNNGLPHTRGGIMNPSILLLPPTWINDPSYPRLRNSYGGKPIDNRNEKLYELFKQFLEFTAA